MKQSNQKSTIASADVASSLSASVSHNTMNASAEMSTHWGFDDPMRLPGSIGRAVYLVGATHLKQEEHSKSLQGLALKRMSFDGRLDQKLLFEIEPQEMDARLRSHWYALVGNIYLKRQADGLIWMRSDVVLDEYFIIERLVEAWSVHMAIEVRDAQGELILFALSSKGVMTWLDALNAEQTASHQNSAAGAITAAVTNAPKKMPQLPEIEGSFGESDWTQIKRYGVVYSPWSIALSIAQTDSKAPSESVQLSHPRSRVVALPDHRVPPLLIVCASREKAERFYTHTAAGRSVQRMKDAGLSVRVVASCDNTKGLPSIYNQVIKPEFEDYTIVFVHDDVWIDDVYLAQHVHEALLRYDVVGVAGNRNRRLHQPAWPFPEKKGVWDQRDNLLGAVAHDVQGSQNKVSVYGTARRGSARLLDGVLLAARGRVLLQAKARFDERFNFHFYDLDFCRTAEIRGLRLGVWPLAISHCSGGNFGGFEWFLGYGRYIGKWGN